MQGRGVEGGGVQGGGVVRRGYQLLVVPSNSLILIAAPAEVVGVKGEWG